MPGTIPGLRFEASHALDLIWGEGFEREGLGERGGHGRVRERELGARERVCCCESEG